MYFYYYYSYFFLSINWSSSSLTIAFSLNVFVQHFENSLCPITHRIRPSLSMVGQYKLNDRRWHRVRQICFMFKWLLSANASQTRLYFLWSYLDINKRWLKTPMRKNTLNICDYFSTKISNQLGDLWEYKKLDLCH